MADEKEIKIVIRAQDEFSGVLERVSRSAEGLTSVIKKNFEAFSVSEQIAQLNEYSTGLQKIRDMEASRAEQRKRADAERNLLRLETNSPYKPKGTGPEKIYLGYQTRLEALQAYNTAVIQEMIKAGMSQDRIESEYTGLSMAYAARKRDFQISAAADTAGAVANTLQNIFVATGSQHRAIFETMKAFAIAQTVIDTYRGATAAYAALAGIPVVGPALATAAAASAVAAGLARVAQIKDTHPGGGSISPGGVANPAYSGGSPSAYPAQTRLAEDSKRQDITINIYNPLSEQNWQKIAEDNIIPAINNASDRNIALTVRTV